MLLSTLKNKISKLLQTSGVYVFKNKNGEILYIGKATNLRSRVGSYFTPLNPPLTRGEGKGGRPIETMIHEVVSIKTIQTDSVLEALILESNLIKQHQPKYNAMGKDDKSFSYFVITKEKFPRVVILRETELNEISKSKLQIPNKIQNSKFKIQNSRVYGPYTSKKQMEIALKIIRKIFPFHSDKQQTEKGCLDFQIGNCPGPYAGAITQEDYKKNIRGIRMILEGKKKSLVKKLEREMKNFSKHQEFEKAGELRKKIFALQHIRDVALISKEEELRVTGYGLRDLRIEAYDISNISGQHATGSMIVFKNSEPDKSQYRKFKIKTIQGADDVGMMREVLLRRFKNNWPASTRGDSSTRGWPQPDLIFLDGGTGHLNMAEKLLKELGFKIPMVAVAKGAKRKSQIQNLNFQINPKSQISKFLKDKTFIKRVMDEAHRFAIGYHKKLRRKHLLA